MNSVQNVKEALRLPSPTAPEKVFAEKRTEQGVAAHLIRDEILTRRTEDAREDELLRLLAAEGILAELHDEEYASAISRVRAGSAAGSIIEELARVVRARRAISAIETSGDLKGGPG